MAYIGKNLVGILKEQKTVDTMTGDGSDTTLALSDTPGSVNNVLVFFDGIRQTPITDYTLMGTTLTFTTAPEASVNVVAISGNWSGVVPKMGSVTSSKIVDGMVMDANIATGVAASKLTGALPAVSGAALTNVVTSSGIDTVSSAPTVSTNPAGGVGTIQLNQTTGEMYVCTDATAGVNHWVNVGIGEGDIFRFQGSVAGYTVGGENTSSNVIDKYSYTTQANATDVGNLVTGGGQQSGHKSVTHGWVAGGGNGTDSIEKYSFASDGDAVDTTKNLSATTRLGSGSSSATHGFSASGNNGSALNNTIDKFSFSDSSNAIDVGNLSVARERATGHSSITHGYTAGGTAYLANNPFYNIIDKYSFSSTGSTSDVGDLTSVRADHCVGASSATHGYVVGGYNGVPPVFNDTTIDKFSFSSDGNSTDIGDCVVSQRHGVATSSTTHGYIGGGHPVSPGTLNNIQRFSFSSDGNSVDWADLTVARIQSAGSQH